jgi:hypothetical protein
MMPGVTAAHGGCAYDFIFLAAASILAPLTKAWTFWRVVPTVVCGVRAVTALKDRGKQMHLQAFGCSTAASKRDRHTERNRCRRLT